MTELIKDYYLNQDMNCAEDLLLSANDLYHLGLDHKAIKLVAGYGAGFGCGSVCGAIAGAMAAISSLAVEERAHATEGFRDLCQEFMERCEAELGSTMCDTLKPKYRTEEERCAPTCVKVGELLTAFIEEKGLSK